MPRQKTLNETYNECLANGQFRDKEGVDTDRIKTMMQLSNAFLESAQDIQKVSRQKAKSGA